MTEKLYDQDAYAVEFDAKVISCEAYQEKKESGYHVILDVSCVSYIMSLFLYYFHL